jgi:hypothetical protein
MGIKRANHQIPPGLVKGVVDGSSLCVRTAWRVKNSQAVTGVIDVSRTTRTITPAGYQYACIDIGRPGLCIVNGYAMDPRGDAEVHSGSNCDNCRPWVQSIFGLG